MIHYRYKSPIYHGSMNIMFAEYPDVPLAVMVRLMLVGWLVVLGFNAALTAKVISWRSETHIYFPGFLTPVLTQPFLPKPPTTFPTCFCRGERRNAPERKVASAGGRTHNHQVMSPTRSRATLVGLRLMYM